MRVFLAIEFTEEIKEYLYKTQQRVKKYSSKGNFANKDNFHLTLRFIGEIKENELNKLKEAIDNTALNQEDFQLRFNELGQFPRGNKRIIWVGLKPEERLDLLYSHLESQLEKHGYPKEERKFVPHITLGREVFLEKEFKEIESQIMMENMEMNVHKISIMESTRINGQLTYIPIYVKEFSY